MLLPPDEEGFYRVLGYSHPLRRSSCRRPEEQARNFSTGNTGKCFPTWDASDRIEALHVSLRQCNGSPALRWEAMQCYLPRLLTAPCKSRRLGRPHGATWLLALAQMLKGPKSLNLAAEACRRIARNQGRQQIGGQRFDKPHLPVRSDSGPMYPLMTREQQACCGGCGLCTVFSGAIGKLVSAEHSCPVSALRHQRLQCVVHPVRYDGHLAALLCGAELRYSSGAKSLLLALRQLRKSGSRASGGYFDRREEATAFALIPVCEVATQASSRENSTRCYG